jgi:alkylhydroperoxidase family enzyme
MDADEIAARHAQVIGVAPRIEPLQPHELDQSAIALHETTKAVGNREDRERGLDDLPEFIGTMLRHPALLTKHTELGIYLASAGTLPPRDRELVILRIAWLCQAPYEFGEHVIIARGQGFTDADIAGLKAGSGDPHWSPHEAAVLRAVEELFANATISDPTWAVLAQSYDSQQLIELPILVGHYQQLSYLFNSLRLRLHPGNDGLAAV